MSVLSVDSVIKPLTIRFNIAMNLVTQQFYARLNPKLGEIKRVAKAADFNYDLKVTLYNLASVYAIYKAACVVFGFSPFHTIRTIGLLLLIRKVIDSSMSIIDSSISITENAGATFQSAWGRLTGEKSIASLSATDTALSTALAGVKITYMTQSGWKEEMIQISGVTIFKNWHLTIPAIMKRFGIGDLRKR